jgi:hypothetical protein
VWTTGPVTSHRGRSGPTSRRCMGRSGSGSLGGGVGPHSVTHCGPTQLSALLVGSAPLTGSPSRQHSTVWVYGTAAQLLCILSLSGGKLLNQHGVLLPQRQ